MSEYWQNSTAVTTLCLLYCCVVVGKAYFIRLFSNVSISIAYLQIFIHLNFHFFLNRMLLNCTGTGDWDIFDLSLVLFVSHLYRL